MGVSNQANQLVHSLCCPSVDIRSRLAPALRSAEQYPPLHSTCPARTSLLRGFLCRLRIRGFEPRCGQQERAQNGWEPRHRGRPDIDHRHHRTADDRQCGDSRLESVALNTRESNSLKSAKLWRMKTRRVAPAAPIARAAMSCAPSLALTREEISGDLTSRFMSPSGHKQRIRRVPSPSLRLLFSGTCHKSGR